MELNSVGLHVLDSRTAFWDPTLSNMHINSELQTSLYTKITLYFKYQYLSIQPSNHPKNCSRFLPTSSCCCGSSIRPLGLQFFLVFYLKLFLLRSLALLGNFGNFGIASEISEVSMATKNIAGNTHHIYIYIACAGVSLTVTTRTTTRITTKKIRSKEGSHCVSFSGFLCFFLWSPLWFFLKGFKRRVKISF